jgi:hypothetical protein
VPEKVTSNVKRKIVVDDKVISARIKRNDHDLQKAPKKPTKIKQAIIEEKKAPSDTSTPS